MPKTKAIILDLDGTVYRGKQVIEGVPETIEAIRKLGIRIFFVSNASTKTREEQAEKLRKMGINCNNEEMYNSAYVTADYLKKNHPKSKVFCISAGGLAREIKTAGLEIVEDDSANVVATGLDHKVNYEKLSIAFRAIRKGAVFVTSNLDRMYPTEKDFLPGSGAIVAFLEYGTQKKTIALGKPEPYMFQSILDNNKLEKAEVLVVGDNYNTDILAAKNLGIKSALVLTGITKKEHIKGLSDRDKPDHVIERFADLLTILQ